MTKDLSAMWEGETPARTVTSVAFLQAIRARLDTLLTG